MPIYVYRAVEGGCDSCREPFEKFHSMDTRLEHCSECSAPIKKQVVAFATSFPKGPSDLRSMGMARLEKRSDGNYENVSAQPGGQKVGSLESFSKDLTKGKNPIIRS